MIAAGKTDVGRVRSSNQDSFDYRVYSDELAWLVVCDGMGGANGGNVASSIAVSTVRDQLERSIAQGLNPSSIKMILTSALAAANSLIYERGQANRELTGMGTTIVAVVVFRNVAYISYAGDSRLYQMRQGQTAQITKDHSVVQMLVDNGEITEEEAKTHPKKRFITRALGVQFSVDPDYRETVLQPGDSILLCTDGLSNYISREEIGPVTAKLPPQAAVEELVAMANARGGSDNITAVVLTV